MTVVPEVSSVSKLPGINIDSRFVFDNNFCDHFGEIRKLKPANAYGFMHEKPDVIPNVRKNYKRFI